MIIPQDSTEPNTTKISMHP